VSGRGSMRVQFAALLFVPIQVTGVTCWQRSRRTSTIDTLPFRESQRPQMVLQNLRRTLISSFQCPPTIWKPRTISFGGDNNGGQLAVLSVPESCLHF